MSESGSFSTEPDDASRPNASASPESGPFDRRDRRQAACALCINESAPQNPALGDAAPSVIVTVRAVRRDQSDWLGQPAHDRPQWECATWESSSSSRTAGCRNGSRTRRAISATKGSITNSSAARRPASRRRSTPSGKVTDLLSGAFESYKQAGGNKGVKSDISCACHWTVNQAASQQIGTMWGKILCGDAGRNHGAAGFADHHAGRPGRSGDRGRLSLRQPLHHDPGARAVPARASRSS